MVPNDCNIVQESILVPDRFDKSEMGVQQVLKLALGVKVVITLGARASFCS